MSDTIPILSQLAQALRTRAGEWLLAGDDARDAQGGTIARQRASEASACAELVDQAIEAERETIRGRLAADAYFAVVEIIGRARRRYVGRITEVEVLGVAYLQVEEPIEGDPANGARIRRVPERAIFGVTLCDEVTALAFHARRAAAESEGHSPGEAGETPMLEVAHG